MPRQLITLELCDVCLGEHDKETPAVWSAIVTIDKLTRDFMLCGAHRDKIIGNLPDLLAKYGTNLLHAHPAKAKSHHKQQAQTAPTNNKDYAHKTQANPRPCQYCDFIAHNNVGLGVHQHASHPAEMKAAKNGAA